MTRRTFLEAAACAGSARAHMREPEFRCALLDPGSDCVLRESLQGFAGAMRGAIKVSADEELEHRQECLFYALPGAGAIGGELGSRLAALVRHGAWLLFESAAGFAGERAFQAQREMLASHFGLAIERPLDLRENGESIVPYVDYLWPAAVKIRDFSRVAPAGSGTRPAAAPVPPRGGRLSWEAIASIAGCSVAVRKRLGNGVLVYLGSPIGPALAAGDGDAHRWLSSLIALAVRAGRY